MKICHPSAQIRDILEGYTNTGGLQENQMIINDLKLIS